MRGSSRITSLDLSGLSSVINFGENVLVDCNALKSVQLPVNNGALFEEFMKAVIIINLPVNCFTTDVYLLLTLVQSLFISRSLLIRKPTV